VKQKTGQGFGLGLYRKVLYSYVLTLFILTGALGGRIAFGRSGEQDGGNTCGGLPGSYCGIFCIYSALKYFDVNVNPEQLIKPRYVGSVQGSSLAELRKAAEEHGLHAAAAARLTIKDLRRSPYPIIIHVKSAATSRKYDHYILFLKSKDGKAWLYNPPSSLELVPFYELPAQWDGTGLIVSDMPIDVGAVFRPGRVRFVIYALVSVVIVCVLRLVRRRPAAARRLSARGLFGLSVAQGAGFVLAAGAAGFTYHFFNDAGFLARANATANIRQAYRSSFIPRLSRRRVRGLLDDNKAVFVDARPSYAPEAGRLTGAVSIPIDTPSGKRHEALADVDKNAPIVVYCQRSACSYAEAMAVRLISDGFLNVSIYRGGWDDWVVGKDGNKGGPS